MLRSLKDLEGYQVRAKDGDLGTVGNFLVDDVSWACRYLVVKTGSFFSERELLVSPMFFRNIEWPSRLFHLAMSQRKLQECPGVDADLPVSRQHERDYYRYFGYPNYWGSSGVWGLSSAPMPMEATGPLAAPIDVVEEASDDVHLRSVKFIRGYHIQGSDGEIGHVEDFIIDDETWQIRYLVVNTSNWWLGKQVLVSPFWCDKVSWESSMIYLGLSRAEVKDCPEWDPEAPVNRVYEKRLFDYYGRPVYWDQPGVEPENPSKIVRLP